MGMCALCGGFWFGVIGSSMGIFLYICETYKDYVDYVFVYIYIGMYEVIHGCVDPNGKNMAKEMETVCTYTGLRVSGYMAM